MKSLFVFYLAIVLPLALLVLAAKQLSLTPGVFVLLLSIYVLVYHPLVSALRLIATNKIKKSDFWQLMIPFSNMKYFSFLFFNK